jgi:Lsr2 protein
MSILIEGVAETLELAGSLGFDPADLADVIEGGPLDAPTSRKTGTGPRSPPGRPASSREHSMAIRTCAKDSGLEVSERRRVAASIVEQYEAASDRKTVPPIPPAQTPKWPSNLAASQISASLATNRSEPLVTGTPDGSLGIPHSRHAPCDHSFRIVFLGTCRLD